MPEKIIQKAAQPYIDRLRALASMKDRISVEGVHCNMWPLVVHARLKYRSVAKEVEPWRKALAEAMERLEELNADRLAEAAGAAQRGSGKIAMLEDKFNKAVAQKEELAAKVEDATIKNDHAGRLLGGLGGEKIRWKETVERLTIEEAT